MRAWLRSNLRCTSASGRSKAIVSLGKLVARTRTAAGALRALLGGGGAAAARRAAKERAAAAAAAVAAATGEECAIASSSCGAASAAAMLHGLRLGTGAGPHGAGSAAISSEGGDLAALARTEAFLQWYSRALVASLYPGAPFGRKQFALDLLLQLLTTWGDASWLARDGRVGAGSAGPSFCGASGQGVSSRAAAGGGCVPDFQPFDPALRGPQATSALLAGLVDSRDKLRTGGHPGAGLARRASRPHACPWPCCRLATPPGDGPGAHPVACPLTPAPCTQRPDAPWRCCLRRCRAWSPRRLWRTWWRGRATWCCRRACATPTRARAS